MKSGIVTRSDPYLMDPSLLVVDPNLVLDCSSSFKDEAHCSYNDSLLDLINCDDSQLESIILGGNGNGLCGSFDMNPMTPENDFDEFLKGLEIGVNSKEQQALTAEAIFAAGTSSIDLTPPLTPVHQPFDQLSACIFDSGIANFEEVAFSSALDDAALSVKSEPPNSPSGLKTDDAAATTSVGAASTATDLDFTDNESVHSFTTESSSATLKRKLQEEDAEDDDDDDFSIASPKAPKRRKPARRNRRVQDERVKNQNKIAALKYRMKKRSEKNVLDIELEVEEEKNKKLKAQVEELTVNVKVLKELLASQLKQ